MLNIDYRFQDKKLYQTAMTHSSYANEHRGNHLHHNERLEFLGDRKYVTTMRPDDIKAIASLSDLARILSGIEEIKEKQNEANLKIRFVTRKIEESAAE